MKTIILAATLAASLGLATIGIADTTVDTNKTNKSKDQTVAPAKASDTKADKTAGCTMPMGSPKSGGCCGM